MKHKIQPVGQGRQARLDRFMRNKNIFVLMKQFESRLQYSRRMCILKKFIRETE